MSAPAERTSEGSWYSLTVRDGAPVALLDDRSGRRWAELRLLASIDTLDGPDETLAIAGPSIAVLEGGVRYSWALRSSRWDAKRLVVETGPDNVAVYAEVEGRGRLNGIRLLGGDAVLPTGSGRLMSGACFESLFCPSPAHPLRIVKRASESAVVGVVSGSEPGRGNWFFTPGPLCFAVSRSPVVDSTIVPDGPWLTVGLGVAAADADMPAFGYDAMDRGFSFGFEYEGKTAVDGTWRTPALVIGQANDPYEGIAAHRRWLLDHGLVDATARRAQTAPAWWRQPIFCGWGAQCRLALDSGLGFRGAAGFATAVDYDRFLAHLKDRGIVPGTIVIDDKWQAAYGTCLPDPAKWPDLRGWIADRRTRDQHVLLWWKAWDAEGLPAEWTIRSASGASLGIDPTHPEAREAIRAAVRTMLAPDQLDADGLKIDFTARTPSGVATRHHGSAWGIALLRELLDVVALEARQVKPDALLIGHTPNPLFGSVIDMVRLNDTLRLDDPEPRVDVVPQMRYRAAVARAALPDHLIDTDDWCAPDLDTWRRYLAIKAELGVPALYYATGLDLSGEDFDDADYRAIASVWAAYRERGGLSAPIRPPSRPA
jgi:hypothetical protein